MPYYFSDEWVRRRTGKHRTTIARWREKQCFPPEIVRLARLELDGELGLIHADWHEIRLCRKSGLLVVPGGFARGPGFREYTPHELAALPWRLAELTALKRERERVQSRPALQAICSDCGQRLAAG